MVMQALRKVSRTFSQVTPVHGFGRALKVAFGPHLNDRGLWPMDSTERELIFWERQVIGVGAEVDKMRVQLNIGRHDELVPQDIRPYISLIPAGGNVLDVGSGPISLLSGGHHKGLWKLTATDLLTNSYQALLNSYGHSKVLEGVRYLACPGERLAEVLAGEQFDFISMNNALDHTNSPRAVIEQMVKITRPGGHIVLSGHTCEGTFENWKGMHQHDLWTESRNLMRCGPHGRDTQSLNAGLPLEWVGGRETKDRNQDMVAVFKRL